MRPTADRDPGRCARSRHRGRIAALLCALLVGASGPAPAAEPAPLPAYRPAGNPPQVRALPVTAAAAPLPLPAAEAVLADGDLVHPAFAPDGRRLAYARVLVRDGVELTEVAVAALPSAEGAAPVPSGATDPAAAAAPARLTGRTLLTAAQSRKYATYAAFASALRWLDDRRLEVTVHDGDVDATVVTLDAVSGAILAEQPRSADAAFAAREARIRRWTAELATPPALPSPVLHNALDKGVRLQGGAFVVQKQYFGYDNHLWLLTPTGALTRLLNLPERGVRLRGAARWKEAVLLLVAYPAPQRAETAYLVRREPHRTAVLARVGPVPAGRAARLVLLHRTSRRLLLFLRTGTVRHVPAAPGLYRYDDAGLHPVQGPQGVAEAVADPRGERLALTVWAGPWRNIHVHRLPDEPR